MCVILCVHVQGVLANNASMTECDLVTPLRQDALGVIELSDTKHTARTCTYGRVSEGRGLPAHTSAAEVGCGLEQRHGHSLQDEVQDALDQETHP